MCVSIYLYSRKLIRLIYFSLPEVSLFIQTAWMGPHCTWWDNTGIRKLDNVEMEIKKAVLLTERCLNHI